MGRVRNDVFDEPEAFDESPPVGPPLETSFDQSLHTAPTAAVGSESALSQVGKTIEEKSKGGDARRRVDDGVVEIKVTSIGCSTTSPASAQLTVLSFSRGTKRKRRERDEVRTSLIGEDDLVLPVRQPASAEQLALGEVTVEKVAIEGRRAGSVERDRVV